MPDLVSAAPVSTAPVSAEPVRLAPPPSSPAAQAQAVAIPDDVRGSELHTAQSALPLGVHAVGAARRFVTATAPQWGISSEHTATAALLVSELVTNAVLYGHGALAVRLRASATMLRVEVADGSRYVPHQRDREDSDEAGLGLLVITACAQAWGVEPHGDGKLVWCDINLTAPPDPPRA